MTDLTNGRRPLLNPQPDWPDRCGWAHHFGSEFLHDSDFPIRRFIAWNNAEDRDLLDQLQAGVHPVEIARRHQRYLYEIEERRVGLVRELEKRLLR